MDGIFLVILLLLKIASKSPTPSKGNWGQEEMDLTVVLTKLCNLPQDLEEEKM